VWSVPLQTAPLCCEYGRVSSRLPLQNISGIREPTFFSSWIRDASCHGAARDWARGREPPSQKATTSVFSLLPKYLSGPELSGAQLPDSSQFRGRDDFNDRFGRGEAILDGHIILSRRLPRWTLSAIDVLIQSATGLKLASPAQSPLPEKSEAHSPLMKSRRIWLSWGIFRRNEPVLDTAIRMRPEITEFLRQDTSSGPTYAESCAGLMSLAGKF